MVFTQKKKGKLRVILICLITVIVISTFAIALHQYALTVTTYNIKTDKTDENFKFVLISDLHNKEFGNNNERLIDKILSETPEFVIIAGDMVTDTSLDYSVAETLVQNLSKSVPVYYTYGNHEADIENSCDLTVALKTAGATLLNNDMVTINIGSDKINIGGLKAFPYFEGDSPKYDNPERHFFDKFLEAQKDTFSLLICHYPEIYTWGFEKFNIDLMLCGHTHGGIIRLPFLGGVFIPNQELFCDYDMGYFDGETADMIITAGLSNSNILPRINNTPEICVITVN